jgi:hypothetical protein
MQPAAYANFNLPTLDYDVVLCNLYRDGNDSAELHADAERGAGYRLARMNGRLAFAERLPMAACWLLQESANEFLAPGSTTTRCRQRHAPPDLPAPTLCSQASMPRRSFTGPPSSKCDTAILRSRSSFSWTKARSSFRMGSTSACEAATALFASSRIRSSRRRFTRCTSGVE